MVQRQSANTSLPVYKSIDDLPIAFGPSELATILGLSRSKAYALVNDPTFPKCKIGKRILISKKHFATWMDSVFCTTNSELRE